MHLHTSMAVINAGLKHNFYYSKIQTVQFTDIKLRLQLKCIMINTGILLQSMEYVSYETVQF